MAGRDQETPDIRGTDLSDAIRSVGRFPGFDSFDCD
jgi:hypothetical protein